tara:strand:+ start:477 stop:788 length:312 start_codon:yes stop_codon:yes gene_type:complete
MVVRSLGPPNGCLRVVAKIKKTLQYINFHFQRWKLKWSLLQNVSISYPLRILSIPIGQNVSLGPQGVVLFNNGSKERCAVFRFVVESGPEEITTPRYDQIKIA